MRAVNRVGGMLALVAVALLGAACGGSSSGDGVFRIGIPADITSANVWQIGTIPTAYNSAVFLNRYPTLMRYSEQRLDWVPGIADGLPGEVLENGDGTFSVDADIRAGLAWSDGEALDANDVAFTVATVLDLELTGGWQDFVNPEFLAGAEAVDDLTVRYRFSRRPGLAIWESGVALMPIVPEHYWAPVIAELRTEFAGDAAGLRNTLLSAAGAEGGEPHAGPVGFVSREAGAFINLERDDDGYLRGSRAVLYENGAYEETLGGETAVYYGDAEGDALLEVERAVDAERVIFNVYQSQDGAVLALRSGEIDYFLSPLGLPVGLEAELAADPEIATIENRTDGFRYLGFNTAREPFNDRAFRQAVAVLIDKEFLADSVLQGVVSPIYSLVPEGLVSYGVNWHNGDIAGLGRGLSREERIGRAVELLKGAGYSWEMEPAWDASQRRVENGDGLRNPAGELIEEFELLSPGQDYDPLRATSAIWIEQWLVQAGIPARVKLSSFNEIVTRVFRDPARDFDVWILGNSFTAYPSDYVSFFNEAGRGDGGNNPGEYMSAEFEMLAAEFLAATDVGDARRLMYAMQELSADDVPYVPLFTTPIREAYRSEVLEFAYTDVLDGVQGGFKDSVGPLSTAGLN